MRRKLVLVFPYYTDWGGFKEESIKNLKDQPVLMEFFKEFEESLNLYVKEPTEKRLKELDDFIYDQTKKHAQEFLDKGYHDEKHVFGERMTNQIKYLIKCVAEKKKNAVKEQRIHLVDEMMSEPITSRKRNEIMSENSIKKISSLFNRSNNLECYILMAKGHVSNIIDSGMLSSYIWSKLKLKLVNEKTNGFRTRVLEYSN
jgi:hypothetical protein